MKLWKTLSRKTVLPPTKFLKLENHEIELPDGRIIPDWSWIITPDFINVVAVTEAGEFICFRQTKYAAGGVTLAIVGGYLEEEEDPLAAAKRELHEETGYQAPDWTNLGSYAIDGNRGCGNAHLFLAQNAVFSGQIFSDDLEEQELILLSRDEVEAALRDGEFKILPWATAVSLALLAINSQQLTENNQRGS